MRNDTALIIRLSHSPYGSGHSRAALDAALAAAALDLRIALVFVGAGVLNLLPGQDPSATGGKSLARTLASLPLYDIETVYAEAAALRRHGVVATTELPHVVALEAEALTALLRLPIPCLSY